MNASTFNMLLEKEAGKDSLKARAEILTLSLSKKQAETAATCGIIPELPYFMPTRTDRKTNIHGPVNQLAYELIAEQGRIYRYVSTYLVPTTRVRTGIAMKGGKEVAFIVPSDGPVSEGFHPVLTTDGKAYAKMANVFHETMPWAPKVPVAKKMSFVCENPEHDGAILDSNGEKVVGAVAVSKSVQMFHHSKWPSLLGDLSKYARDYFTLSIAAKNFDVFLADEKWASLPGTRTLVTDWCTARAELGNTSDELVSATSGEKLSLDSASDEELDGAITRLEYIDAQNTGIIRDIIRDDIAWALKRCTSIIRLDYDIRFADGERKKVLKSERGELAQEAKDTIASVAIAQRNSLEFLARCNRLAGASDAFSAAANDALMATK